MADVNLRVLLEGAEAVKKKLEDLVLGTKRLEAVDQVHTRTTQLNAQQQRLLAEWTRQRNQATQRLRDHTAQLVEKFRAQQRQEEALQRSSSKLTEIQERLTLIVKNLVAVYATYKLAGLIKDMTMLHARHRELGVIMQVVGNQAGFSRAQMEEAANTVKDFGITMTESRNSVIRMVQAQIDLSTGIKLARAAQDAATIGAVNSSEALERMVYAIQSGSLIMLRTLGINVQFGASYDKAALAMGRATEELTEQEKVNIRAQEVLKATTRIMGAYEGAMTEASKQLRSMERHVEDFKLQAGETFNEVLVASVMALTAAFKGLGKEAAELSAKGKLKEWGQNITTVFAYAADAAVLLAQGWTQISLAVGLATASIAAAARLATKDEFKSIWEVYTEGVESAVKRMSLFTSALEDVRRAAAMGSGIKDRPDPNAQFNVQMDALLERFTAQISKGTKDKVAELRKELKSIDALLAEGGTREDVVVVAATRRGQVAKELAAELKKIGEKDFAEREKQRQTEDQIMAERFKMSLERTKEFYAEVARLEKPIDALRDEFATEDELAEEHYMEQLAKLVEWRQAGLDTNNEFDRLYELLNAQHQARLIAKEQKKHELIRGMELDTVNLAVGLLQTFAGKSKEAAILLIAINKALSIARAIQNTAVAVMAAYAIDPTGVLSARVQAIGSIQIGLIAATGLAEISQVGAGGAALGTTANPVSVAPVGPITENAAGQRNQQITVINFYGTMDERKLVRRFVNTLNEDRRDGSRFVLSDESPALG